MNEQEWIKIQSFDRIHQAELRKNVLEQNGIQAVVVNERDSLFLIGEIELYVRKQDEKQALELINEFRGLMKVDSFVMLKPIENLKKVLDENNIFSIIKTVENPNYPLANYELFVHTEDKNRIVSFITGQSLIGWKKVDTIFRTRQAKLRVELLNENNIESIIIKKRDSQFRKKEINIYVKDADYKQAQTILDELIGWIKIDTFDMLHRGELRENLLKMRNIKAILKLNSDNFYDFYVPTQDEEHAIAIINKHKNFVKIETCSNEVEANYISNILENQQINTVLINRIDRVFNLGEVEVYVDDNNVVKAKEILKDIIK